MALKRKVTKAQYDKLSDELKKEYKEDGDNYTLDVDGDEDTGTLKRAKDRVAQELKEVKEELNELRAENEKLEKSKAGDVNKLQKKWDDDKATLEATHKEEIAKRDSFIVKSLKTGLAEKISAALNPKSPKVFTPHVEARLSVDLSGDVPKVVILGPDGKPSDMTPEKLQAEFVANKDFAGMIVVNKASGGAGTNNNGPGGGAPGQQQQQPASLASMKPSELAARLKASKEAQT